MSLYGDCYTCGEPGCAGCGYPPDRSTVVCGTIRWKEPPPPVVKEPDWKSRALAAEGMLRELVWTGGLPGRPACIACKRVDLLGHSPTCRLAALLVKP